MSQPQKSKKSPALTLLIIKNIVKDNVKIKINFLFITNPLNYKI